MKKVGELIKTPYFESQNVYNKDHTFKPFFN